MKASPVLLALSLLAHPAVSQKPERQQPASRPAAKQPKLMRKGGYFGLFLSERMEAGKRRVVIESVFPGSDAEKLGFKAGDLVAAVNGRRVPSGDRFIQMLYMTDPRVPMGRRRRRQADPLGPDGKAPDNKITVTRAGKNVDIKAGLTDLDLHPRVGDPAPDFTATTKDGKEKIKLSSRLGERPLVLIFGSFT